MAACLVVEYKGAMLADASDTLEKQTIGRLWEHQSGGRGLFLLVTLKDEQGNDARRQIQFKVGRS